jgi:putative ABC transport system permease protein
VSRQRFQRLSGIASLAWRGLVRQPARASLGVLGVAAIGALLFDMLLLSNGLVLSMQDLFDRAGFDLRVTATEALPGQGPRLPDADAALRAIAGVPGVRSAVAMRFADALVETDSAPRPVRALLQGASGTGSRPWTLLRGGDLGSDRDVIVNETAADQLRLEPGGRVRVRAECVEGQSPPPVWLTVIGIGEFPFDPASRSTLATTMAAMDEVCGRVDAGSADLIMVAAHAEGASLDAAAVARAVPHLSVVTNQEMVGRLQRGGFSYFRQISTVLTTVTLAFAVLLIAVLLTVSVNQRLGEIAALRALGFTRWRVAADVICESALIVFGGGALSLPLGLALARALDAILKGIPGIPADAHFFVFQPQALQWHAAMLAAAAIVAALYPVHIVARLPIAATLRDEVVG